jgi:GH24 family phage-related lysozyme (muramidase)
MAHIDPDALKLIKDFEKFVPYVYDDARAPVRGVYREWAGEAVLGTLTIGYGHTNAAGPPYIMQGMRITEQQASQILEADLGKVIHEVDRLVRVPLNDHQKGALYSFHFNCGKLGRSTALKHVNAGRLDKVPGALMLYNKTTINGQLVESRGLVRRRRAECALWRSLPEEIVAPRPDEAKAPEIVADPVPPKTMKKSREGWISLGTGTGAAVNAANEAAKSVQNAPPAPMPEVPIDQIIESASKIGQAKSALEGLGLTEIFGSLQPALTNHVVIFSLLIALGMMFMLYMRRRRLYEEHV